MVLLHRSLTLFRIKDRAFDFLYKYIYLFVPAAVVIFSNFGFAAGSLCENGSSDAKAVCNHKYSSGAPVPKSSNPLVNNFFESFNAIMAYGQQMALESQQTDSIPVKTNAAAEASENFSQAFRDQADVCGRLIEQCLQACKRPDQTDKAQKCRNLEAAISKLREMASDNDFYAARYRTVAGQTSEKSADPGPTDDPCADYEKNKGKKPLKHTPNQQEIECMLR